MKTSSWRQLRVVLLSGLIGLLAAAVILAGLLAWRPAFYREALAREGEGPEVEARARRLVTKASALHAAVTRPVTHGGGDALSGRWEAAIRDDEVNAWLALDLPRSHPNWLPRGVSAPRCGFRPRHAVVAARVGYGPLSTVASADFELVLRDVNQLAIALAAARVGAIPLPNEAIMHELSRRITRLGMVTDLRRLEGRLVLLVHVPSAPAAGASHHRIEMLSLADGELLVAGSTGSPSEIRTAPVPLPP